MRVLLPLLLVAGIVGCGSETEPVTPSAGTETKLVRTRSKIDYRIPPMVEVLSRSSTHHEMCWA